MLNHKRSKLEDVPDAPTSGYIGGTATTLTLAPKFGMSSVQHPYFDQVLHPWIRRQLMILFPDEEIHETPGMSDELFDTVVRFDNPQAMVNFLFGLQKRACTEANRLVDPVLRKKITSFAQLVFNRQRSVKNDQEAQVERTAYERKVAQVERLTQQGSFGLVSTEADFKFCRTLQGGCSSSSRSQAPQFQPAAPSSSAAVFPDSDDPTAAEPWEEYLLNERERLGRQQHASAYTSASLASESLPSSRVEPLKNVFAAGPVVPYMPEKGPTSAVPPPPSRGVQMEQPPRTPHEVPPPQLHIDEHAGFVEPVSEMSDAFGTASSSSPRRANEDYVDWVVRTQRRPAQTIRNGKGFSRSCKSWFTVRSPLLQSRSIGRTPLCQSQPAPQSTSVLSLFPHSRMAPDETLQNASPLVVSNPGQSSSGFRSIKTPKTPAVRIANQRLRATHLAGLSMSSGPMSSRPGTASKGGEANGRPGTTSKGGDAMASPHLARP
eukprot:gnl/MRDRNA2_/MRDRNA2_86721_c4_seq2.p1 gnl/MRDRNA2_/MRDRNA2_86721_c4~~gnl/MRDRNA2_/MRDRNA2_86721_c4_seq2.p1  ORF type:complete len:491 (+),score=68.25 gnl/MRDRNA2_/MRDRNA2_86721_c4_seq2:141-1613(+)